MKFNSLPTDRNKSGWQCCRHFLFAGIILIINTFSGMAQNEKAFSRSTIDFIKADTLDFRDAFLPRKLFSRFPAHITNSKEIKQEFKKAIAEQDGYMIYMLAILEYNRMFTYGNLSPINMLEQAFETGKEQKDPVLCTYVLSYQLKYNLFGIIDHTTLINTIYKLALEQKHADILFEIANYAEYLDMKNPSASLLRYKAYNLKSVSIIHNEEFDYFWHEFKSFCKKPAPDMFPLYISPVVEFIYYSFGEEMHKRQYTLKEITQLYEKPETIKAVEFVPRWTDKTESVTTSNSVQEKIGSESTLYQAVGTSLKNPETEYVYIIGISGETSYRTNYFFVKSAGAIKLNKIIFEEL